MSTEAAIVKVYNLTDVSTKNLEQRKCVNQHIAIGNRMCEPGQFVEVTDSASLRSDLNHLVSIGALAIDALPPPYRAARAAQDNASGLVPPARIQHLDIKETKVVDTVAAPPPPVAPPEEPAVEAEGPKSAKPKK